MTERRFQAWFVAWVLVVGLTLAGLQSGCASLVAETPQQRMYAAVADFKNATAAAADYCSTPDASVEACRRALALFEQADSLLRAVESGLRNGTLPQSDAADILRILADVIDQLERVTESR